MDIIKFLARNSVTNILIILMCLGLIVNIFTPDFSFFKRSAELANPIMLAYLGLGIFFLTVRQQKLMITALLCTGIMAFYLKENTNARIKYAAPNSTPKYKINLVNLTSIDSDPEKILDDIKKGQPDIIVFQEYTPKWADFLKTQLVVDYEHSILLPRIDVYGLCVYSKINLRNPDTTYYENIPILKIDIAKRNKNISLFTTYVAPPLTPEATERSKEQFNLLGTMISSGKNSSVVLGVFNQVPWSPELSNIKYINSLLDARIGFMPGKDKNESGLFNKPITHIYYSPSLECTLFNLSSADNDEYGVDAIFQFPD